MMYIQQAIIHYMNNRENTWVKISCWILVFIVLLWWNELFRLGMFHPTNLILNVFAFIQVIGFYYLFRFFFYPYLKERKWWHFSLLMITAYIVSNLLITIPLHISVYLYPKEPRIGAYFSQYAINSPSDIIDKHIFLWFLTITLWCNLLTIVAYIAFDMFILQKKRLASIRARDDMEIGFLRAQIQPHFLFNTLNNIYGLLINQEKESNLILNLSHMMRFSLYESRANQVSLNNEILFMKQYLEIEQILLAKNGISVKFDLENRPNIDKTVSPLVLSRFLEISIETLVDKGHNDWVTVKLDYYNETVALSIKYPTIGYPTLTEKDLPEEWLRRAELEYPNSHSVLYRNNKGNSRFDLTLYLQKDLKKTEVNP